MPKISAGNRLIFMCFCDNQRGGRGQRKIPLCRPKTPAKRACPAQISENDGGPGGTKGRAHPEALNSEAPSVSRHFRVRSRVRRCVRRSKNGVNNYHPAGVASLYSNTIFSSPSGRATCPAPIRTRTGEKIVSEPSRSVTASAATLYALRAPPCPVRPRRDKSLCRRAGSQPLPRRCANLTRH